MSNKHVVPAAKEAMEKFKMETANEVGVNLKQGYNGDLTSKQATASTARWSTLLYPYVLSDSTANPAPPPPAKPPLPTPTAWRSKAHKIKKKTQRSGIMIDAAF